MCETASEFFGSLTTDRVSHRNGFDNSVKAKMDNLLVLRVFEHTFITESGESDQSIGIVFTSRRLFDNVRRAIEGQSGDGGGVLGAVDGTYKLHYGQWVLATFGTYSTNCSRFVVLYCCVGVL